MKRRKARGRRSQNAERNWDWASRLRAPFLQWNFTLRAPLAPLFVKGAATASLTEQPHHRAISAAAAGRGSATPLHVSRPRPDTLLDLPAGADRDQLLAAAKGHMIGKGVVTGFYQQSVKPPKSGGPPANF